MKNLTFLIVVFVIGLLTSYHSIAQCSITDPVSCIDSSLAETRIDMFKKIKKYFMVGNNTINVDTAIMVSSTNMIDILSQLDPGQYDGLRIYFALTPKIISPTMLAQKPNNFILVMVPTKVAGDEYDEDGYRFSEDDSAHAIIFDDDELKFVDIRKAGAHKFIRKWITHYQNITNRIKNGFDGLNIKFVEAKSLWYSSEILFQRTPRGLDLLSYLKANTNITSIKVHFASFGLEPENLDYRYEMDLIFQFYEGSGAPSSYLTLATPEIKKHIQLLKKELPTKDKETQEKMQKDIQALSQYADTAIPCPPAKCPN